LPIWKVCKYVFILDVCQYSYLLCIGVVVQNNNMAASNGTVGQTGNDFIISEQHLIMHCKFTNALYRTCLIENGFLFRLPIRVIFYLYAISFFPAVKLHVFGYWTFVWFMDFYSSWQGQDLYCITRSEKNALYRTCLIANIWQFVWTISSEQQHRCTTSMNIDKHRE
jgi:hypothetical protein